MNFTGIILFQQDKFIKNSHFTLGSKIMKKNDTCSDDEL